MALRKPMYMDSEGFHVEMPNTDSIELGGLKMYGALDANSQNITNVPDTPSAGSSAVNKNYVDAVAQGLAIKSAVHVLAASNIGSLSGVGAVVDGHTLAADDRILLTAQTDVPFSGTGDSLTESGGVVTLVDAAGAFVAEDVGSNITISGATNPGNNGTFVIASYVDATSVTFANASGVTETSSFAYTGDQGVSNGIWVVKSGAWVRPTDFAAGSHSGHAFTFVETGTLYGNTGWVCISDFPADLIGTDALAWVQFSSAGIITASTGLTKVGNDIRVKKGDGIEVTSNSASTNIDLATNPGLELNGTSPNKKLKALVSATGGVQIDGANGLALLLNGTTLQVGGSGVSVKGLPNLFEIGGTATSQTPGTGQVTAANLNTLTAGASSNADTLHTHAVAAAPYAGRIENAFAVSEAIAAGDPVYQSATNDQVGKGDAANDAKSRIIGIARTAQVTPGNTSSIVAQGPCASILSGATANTPYYLASGGGLTTTRPTGNKRVILAGFAKNATDLHVHIVDYGKAA